MDISYAHDKLRHICKEAQHATLTTTAAETTGVLHSCNAHALEKATYGAEKKGILAQITSDHTRSYSLETVSVLGMD